MKDDIKLNLGCGLNPQSGYINVDKYGSPDLQWDLEVFPWPWEDSSVSEVMMHHVLEHLGEDSKTYLRLIQELYRVCHDQAELQISVPHPRHNDFINDPTHVRPITPMSLQLFSKKYNEECLQAGFSNSPLAIHLDVDFELIDLSFSLDPEWEAKRDAEGLSSADIYSASKQFNNVIQEIQMKVKVIKKPN